MKKSMAVAAVVAGVIASAAAQDIVIDSISGNGSINRVAFRKQIPISKR